MTCDKLTYSLGGKAMPAVIFALLLAGAAPRAAALPDLPAPLVASEAARVGAIEKASRVTLSVFAAEKSGGGGSGVVITSDGYALTNFHVVQPCGPHMKCGMNDGRLYDAVLVGLDPTGDVALIKLLGRDDFPAAELADSDQVRVGDECFAVGNPFLLATDLHPTVTFGVVSGVGRYQPPAAGAILEYTDCIQTDAAINPGNSGGPLFNAQGQLVGINGRGSFEKRGRVNVGVGYAISINQIKNFLGVLHSGRIVDHATLGATATTDEGGMVVVTNILEASDAYRRGLRYGDELISLAERRIDSANTLKNVLGILPKGWRVPLTYRRDDQVLETWVRLAGVHSEEALLQVSQQDVAPEEPPAPIPESPPGEERPEKDGDQKPRPPRRGLRPERKPAGFPEAIAQVYETRRGYANYYFNRIQRDRVWTGLSRQFDVTLHPGRWTLSGQLNAQGTLRISLDDQQVFARLATPDQSQELVIDMQQNLADQREPRGSGGLYLALHQWRRLLTRQPDQFGEVYFWGTAPLRDREGQFDVLTGIHDVIETRFYFDPTSGRLVALEMFPDADVDPCELYFDDFRSLDGQLLPHQIEVRYGDQSYGTLKLDQVQFESPPPEDAS
jgi:serine protease Do